MGLFDKLGYFLSGSSDTSVSYGKKKTVDEIRKERVTLSNGSWNHTLREHLKTINCYDCSNQLSMVQTAIENAKKAAQFNYGTFIMENDVKEKYLQLLAEHERQMAEKKKLEEEKKLRAEQKAEKERLEKEKKQSEQAQLKSQCIHISVNKVNYSNEYNRETIEKNVQIPIEKIVSKYKLKLAESGFSDITLSVSDDNKSIELMLHKGGIRYGYQCKFYSSNNKYLYDFTDNIVQDVVLNCILAFNSVEFCGKQEAERALRKYFEDNHYSYINVFSKNNHVHVFATKYKTKFGMQYWCDSPLQTSEEESVTVDFQSDNDFDSMDGIQFEKFCAEILEKNGYENVSVTRGSGDQGIDIIAFRDGVKYGIQCKCYSSDIGNKAVQEVYAGKTFYQCHVAVVLTNRYFTSSAKDLANRNGVVLWDRSKLLELVNFCA